MEKFYGSLKQFSEKDLRMIFCSLMNTVDRYCKGGNVEEKKLAEGLVNILQNHIDEVGNIDYIRVNSNNMSILYSVSLMQVR